MSIILNQIDIIEQQTANMPFWKVGFFEIMCVERLWKVYEKACVGKEWDKHVEFRKIMELAWGTVLKDLEIEERYLIFCESCITDNVRDELDTSNNAIVCAIGTLLDEINKKANNRVYHVITRNFEFLDDFLYNYYDLKVNSENEKFINNHELIMEEVVQQNKVIEKLNKTNRKEEFYFWGRENCGKSILGDFWLLE